MNNPSDAAVVAKLIQNMTEEKRREMLSVFSPSSVLPWTNKRNGAVKEKDCGPGRRGVVTTHGRKWFAIVHWDGKQYCLSAVFTPAAACAAADRKINSLVVEELKRAERLAVVKAVEAA